MSLDPAINSGSRFPLVCRLTSVSDSEERDLLNKFSLLPSSLNIVGRIAPDQVAEYVAKVVETADTDSLETIVEMIPLKLKRIQKKRLNLSSVVDDDQVFDDDDLDDDDSDDDLEDDDEALLFRENYEKFISYLIQRKRFAVVDVKSRKKTTSLKDVYLFPFDPSEAQFSSPVFNDLLSKSPLMQSLNSSTKKSSVSRSKKPKNILVMLLVRKTSSSTPSSSSTATSSSHRSHRSHSGSKTSNDKRTLTPPLPAVKMAITLPNQSMPGVVSYTPTPTTKLASYTPSQVTSKTIEEQDYDPEEAYIPGLSPERRDQDEREDTFFSTGSTSTPQVTQEDEKELIEKALIQMKLLQNN